MLYITKFRLSCALIQNKFIVLLNLIEFPVESPQPHFRKGGKPLTSPIAKGANRCYPPFLKGTRGIRKLGGVIQHH